jgi:alginate O-acetyltransferase complex protein AlgI
VGYVVDVKRGYMKAERNPLLVLLCLSFYPTIVAGPLIRANKMMFQFRNRITVLPENCSEAFRLFIIALFKNFVLGQRLLTISIILSENGSGFYTVLQGLSFFLYLYFIFSSYVDISRGIGKIIGLDIPDNFRNRVYASASRREFWKGWHITLNDWFRDYVFFPLAKLYRNKFWMKATTLIVFLFIGLWHGITAGFVIWGILNGCWVLAEQAFAKNFSFNNTAVKKIIGVLYHLSIASVLALIFSTPNLADIADRLFSKTVIAPDQVRTLMWQTTILALFFILFDLLMLRAGEKPVEKYLGTKNVRCRWFVYILIMLSIIVAGTEISPENYYIKF